MADDTQEEAEVAAELAPTVTQSEIEAHRFMESLDELAGTVPWLEYKFTPRARKAARHRVVTKKFMATASEAVRRLPELEKLATFSADDVTLLYQDEDAYKQVIRKLQALMEAFQYSLDLRKADLADATLRIYAIAQALLRDPGSAQIGPYVAAMKRDLGRKGRGAKVKPSKKKK